MSGESFLLPRQNSVRYGNNAGGKIRRRAHERQTTAGKGFVDRMTRVPERAVQMALAGHGRQVSSLLTPGGTDVRHRRPASRFRRRRWRAGAFAAHC